MELNNLDGNQFEELVGILLNRMGFITEMTSPTGDGGIDIVAHLETPILKGKYLIQCKRWKSPVGEPVVRDLYGVVLSENANKGIIITNSTYTEKAIEFASGKNIELIDGLILKQLLDEKGLQNPDHIAVSNSFIYSSDFDREKYDYIRHRIQEEPSNQDHYELLQSLYHLYILDNKVQLWEAGLLDGYISFNNEYIKRFCRRSKERIEEGNAVSYINGYLNLLKGSFAKAIEIFRDLGILNIGSLMIIPECHYQFGRGETKKEGNKCKYAMIINILVLLSRLNLDQQRTNLINRYNGYAESWKKTNLDYYSSYEHEFFDIYEAVQKVFNDIANKNRIFIYHPTKYIVFRDRHFSKSGYDYHVNFQQGHYTNVYEIVSKIQLQKEDCTRLSLLFDL